MDWLRPAGDRTRQRERRTDTESRRGPWEPAAQRDVALYQLGRSTVAYDRRANKAWQLELLRTDGWPGR